MGISEEALLTIVPDDLQISIRILSEGFGRRFVSSKQCQPRRFPR